MKKLHEFKSEITVFAYRDRVWDLLVNQFGYVNKFNPLIDASHPLDDNQGEVGCERHCKIDDKNSVREKITDIKGKESVEIEIIEGGLPMMDQMFGRFSLKVAGNGKTRVTMQVSYNTKPAIMAPLLKGQMKKEFTKLLVGMKYYLETNHEVTKSNIRNILENYDVIGEEANFEILSSAPTLA